MRKLWSTYKNLNLQNKISWTVIIVFLFIAVFAGLLADHKPLYVNYNGQHFFPSLSTKTYIEVEDKEGATVKVQSELMDWSLLDGSKILRSPIPFSPYRVDLSNANFKEPLSEQKNENRTSKKHLLGTDKLGRDVLSGLIHGARISLFVGFISMILAFIAGILIGLSAAFYSNSTLKFKRVNYLSIPIAIILSWFYAIHIRSAAIANAFHSSKLAFILQVLINIALFFLLFLLIKYCLNKILGRGYFAKKIDVPIDNYLSRLIEIFISIPKLIVILSLAAVVGNSISLLILMIALMSWPHIARISRAEALKVKEMDFTIAARASGLSNAHIILRHILPNILPPVLAAFALGVASAILTESALSFLGIGIPSNIVTWGSMLANGSANLEAWWLVVFPGTCLFLVILSLNRIATSLGTN